MRVFVAVAAVLLLLLAIVVGAAALDRVARDKSRSATQRLQAARVAARLQPFSERAQTTLAIAEARRLLDGGEIQAAYELLLPLSAVVRGDALFRETYQEAVRRKWPIDARKAHQQHAREGRRGQLRPEDVER
jgi:hypothetical protein